MPDSLLESGSEFDRTKTLLGRWLRTNVKEPRALKDEALSAYGGEHRFAAGWQIELEMEARAQIYHVLFDGRFPYSPIRIAYKSPDMYLKWPHVEPGGLLCLPRRAAPSTDVESAMGVALSDAIELIRQCRDPQFVDSEFQREFGSYWSRCKDKDGKPVRSLLNLTDQRSRVVSVWFSDKYILVGENSDQLLSWLKNRGRTEGTTIVEGLFVFLSAPPTPPYPSRPADLFGLLHQCAPGLIPLFSRLSIRDPAMIVMAAHTLSGTGPIATRISTPRNFDGFRNLSSPSFAIKMALWKMKCDLTRLEVCRFDAAWVHGRGFNKDQVVLGAATVLVLGCGSLGSQVAVGLAQAGVGGLILVDPDKLSTANVGRHALGIDSVNLNKATALANDLRKRFPHMNRIDAHPGDWQSLYNDNANAFSGSNLIVACLGDWKADGQLGEWQVRSPARRHIVYGWLDGFGVASHAVALDGVRPALSCILDLDGELRRPETLWDGDRLVQSEPACGTLFQPYGPIDVTQAEALVSRLCMDVLIGSATPPCHRVYAGSTAQLNESGGTWSASHLQHRPPGFEGSFQYERVAAPCGQCASCNDVQ